MGASKKAVQMIDLVGNGSRWLSLCEGRRTREATAAVAVTAAAPTAPAPLASAATPAASEAFFIFHFLFSFSASADGLSCPVSSTVRTVFNL